MFDFLVKLYSEKGWKIGEECVGHADRPDMEKSIYVGDAAGRPTDHSNTDLTMALNAGLRFATPEVRTISNRLTSGAFSGSEAGVSFAPGIMETERP